MRRNSMIFFAPIAIFLLITALIVRIPARPVEKPVPDASCCKEKATCTEPGKNTSDDLMLENLSRQFILVSPLN